MSLRTRVKSVAAELARLSGLLAVASHYQKRKGALVLMYHRVLPEDYNATIPVPPGMYVSEKTFHQHIQILISKYHIVPLHEIFQRVVAGKSVKNCCAITFDDGWRDNYQYAFPILNEYKAPATIFLASDYIATNKLFWPDEFIHFLSKNDWSFPSDLHNSSPLYCQFVSALSLDGSEPPMEIVDRSIALLKSYPPQERERIMSFVRNSIQDDPPQRLMLNWSEVDEMAQSGLVDYGGHSQTHELLDQLTKKDVETEVNGSYLDIANHLAKPVVSFAYPNGNYTHETIQVLKQSHYLMAVTTRKGLWTEATSHFEIPRIGIHDDISRSPARFLARISLKGF